jgi:hypothetical protein
MEVKDTNVEEGKRLRSLGCYGEAVTIFSGAAESPTLRLEVITELGETLLLQGYYNRALEILDKALCDAKATEDPFLPPTQLLRCCIAAIVTAKLKKCVKDAEQVYNGLGKVDFSGIPGHCKVSHLILVLLIVHMDGVLIRARSLRNATTLRFNYLRSTVEQYQSLRDIRTFPGNLRTSSEAVCQPLNTRTHCV